LKTVAGQIVAAQIATGSLTGIAFLFIVPSIYPLLDPARFWKPSRHETCLTDTVDRFSSFIPSTKVTSLFDKVYMPINNSTEQTTTA
jgi:hypothetical protein